MEPYIPRKLNLMPALKEKSCFLFGPRQTGKSSLIEHELGKKAIILDLLDEDIFLRFQQTPKALMDFIIQKDKIIVIDEIQRVPHLLNEIHRLIEKEKLRFLLTGSSARNLRKKGVNLLGGRARSRFLHPFVSDELKERFDLFKVIQIGLLPSIYFSSDPWDDLKSYVGSYLTQEIIMEAATRNLPAFSRFLEVAAISSGHMLNYEKIANDAKVPRSTTQAYYQILRDTLIGSDLVPFRKTKTRKAIATAKFYFFDIGVVNYLKHLRSITENSSDFGHAFEAWVFHELASFCDYTKTDVELSYWRSSSGYEVDFLLNDEVAIEVKTTRHVSRDDLKGLDAIGEEIKLKQKIIICRETIEQKTGDIKILPYPHFIKALWDGSIYSPS